MEPTPPSMHQPNGPIVDNKPFKISLKAGEFTKVLNISILLKILYIYSQFDWLFSGVRYSWCMCGQSKTQPLCDGTHEYVHFKIKEKYGTHQNFLTLTF